MTMRARGIFGWNEINGLFEPLNLDADVNPSQGQYRLKDRDNVVSAMSAVEQYLATTKEPNPRESDFAIKSRRRGRISRRR